jgi:hypothetical protein
LVPVVKRDPALSDADGQFQRFMAVTFSRRLHKSMFIRVTTHYILAEVDEFEWKHCKRRWRDVLFCETLAGALTNFGSAFSSRIMNQLLVKLKMFIGANQ